MGYSHQSYNTSPISEIISVLDEYKINYKSIKVSDDNIILITKNNVYLECSIIDNDCDGTSIRYHKKYNRDELFKNPIIWKYYIEGEFNKTINTDDYKTYIGKPCYNFKNTGYCKFKHNCRYLH